MRSNIAHQVKKAREAAGLSQEQLAYILNTNNIYISLMENAKRPVSIKWLKKIAIATQHELVIALMPKEEQPEQPQQPKQPEPQLINPVTQKPIFY